MEAIVGAWRDDAVVPRGGPWPPRRWAMTHWHYLVLRAWWKYFHADLEKAEASYELTDAEDLSDDPDDEGPPLKGEGAHSAMATIAIHQVLIGIGVHEFAH